MSTESIEKMSEAFRNLGTAFGEFARPIVDVFSNAWEQIKALDSIDKTMSRKRFVKLLMSQGIQRNEANKIAWKVHAEKGKYTLLDYALAIKKKEE
ncbi:MAG: hypothetical protein J5982_03460 [Bacilli bacterium]|nr:hypothetical protein [Bacilli bacterium]